MTPWIAGIIALPLAIIVLFQYANWKSIHDERAISDFESLPSPIHLVVYKTFCGPSLAATACGALAIVLLFAIGHQVHDIPRDFRVAATLLALILVWIYALFLCCLIWMQLILYAWASPWRKPFIEVNDAGVIYKGSLIPWDNIKQGHNIVIGSSRSMKPFLILLLETNQIAPKVAWYHRQQINLKLKNAGLTHPYIAIELFDVNQPTWKIAISVKRNFCWENSLEYVSHKTGFPLDSDFSR
jgi:hypothetical protein